MTNSQPEVQDMQVHSKRSYVYSVSQFKWKIAGGFEESLSKVNFLIGSSGGRIFCWIEPESSLLKPSKWKSNLTWFS